MGTSKETTTNTAGPQSPEAARMMQLLGSTVSDAAGQMGDLSQIAAGKFEMSPYMLEQLSRLQQIMGDQSRLQMDQNMDTASRHVEDTAIGRSIGGSTMEAVLQGTVGAQHQQSANMQALGQEAQGVQAGINMPLQMAQAQIQGNQALMARLVGGSTAGLNYDQAIRQLNSTRVTEKEEPLGQTIFNGAVQLGSAAMGGGAAPVGPQISNAGVPGYISPSGRPYQGPIQ